MAQTGGFFSGAAPSPTGSMGGGAIGSGGGMMLTPAMSRPQAPQNQQMIPGQQNNQGSLSPMGMYAKSAQMGAMQPAPAQGGMIGGTQPGGSGFGQSGLSRNPQVGGVGMGTNPQWSGQAIGGMPTRQGDQSITQMGTRVGTGGASGPVSWGSAQPMQSMPGQLAQASQGRSAASAFAPAPAQAQPMGGMARPQPMGGIGAPPPQQAPAFGAQNSARQGFAPAGRNQMVQALRRPV